MRRMGPAEQRTETPFQTASAPPVLQVPPPTSLSATVLPEQRLEEPVIADGAGEAV